MGGAQAVAKFHAQGRVTAREQIDALIDPGTLRELGSIAGQSRYDEDDRLVEFTPSNHVLGTARIHGRKSVVIADDATLRGGSLDASVAEKWVYADRLAFEQRMPLVRLVDSGGGSIKSMEQIGASYLPGFQLLPRVALLGVVPVVAVAVGACAGLAAVRVGLSHFSVMVRGKSQVFAGGPPVVKQALGIEVDKETLGGWDVHKQTGVVGNAADSVAQACVLARRFLSFLPGNVWQAPPRIETGDAPDRETPWLNDAIPHNRKRGFDVRRILNAIFDTDSLFELSPEFGASTVTALARLDGHAVGVISNDPVVQGGALTAAAAKKLERFVDLCDTFHLPIVHLPDQPGTMIGPQAERDGTLGAALRASAAVEQSSVPWIAIVIRRCFGFGGNTVSPWFGPSGTALPHRFGWPSARWGSVPPEGGVMAAFRREIAGAPDPSARRLALEEHYHRLASPMRTAGRFGVVDIIEPATTRPLLCDWVEDAVRMAAGRLGPTGRAFR